jgi:NRPS condensation-like uncharacterized protein
MLNAELTDAALFALRARHGDMAMHAVVDLRTAFTRDKLENALRATVAAFPVLGHCYRPGLWRDRWVEVTAPLSDSVHVIRITSDASIEDHTSAWVREPIVPTRDRPIRVVAILRDQGMRLILSILHLVGDGAGVAAASHVFGSHLRGAVPDLPTNTRRDVMLALDGLPWLAIPRALKAFAGLMLDPVRHALAARLQSRRADSAAEPAAWSQIRIARAELEHLKQQCGATVNDVLIGALARVAGERSEKGRVVITYTMDLRRHGKEPRLTVTNASSILSAVIPRGALTDLPAAASAAAEITARQRRKLSGPAFMLGPRTLLGGAPHAALRGLVPFVAPLMVDLPLGRGLMVTNVGRVDDALGAFGDDVQDLRFVGPFVERLPIPVIVAFGYRGDLHLAFFAPQGIGRARMEELAADVVRTLGLPPR